MMLPRMLPRGRAHLMGKLIARFEPFQRGDWHILLEASGVCDFRAASPGTDPAEGMKMRSSSGPSEQKV